MKTPESLKTYMSLNKSILTYLNNIFVEKEQDEVSVEVADRRG